MKTKALLVVCVLLQSAGLAAAQSKTAADAISGTWTGTMGPNESDQNAITVTLKSDGKTLTGLITGPPYPGDITGGSFDPGTGALRLDVVVRDDDKTRVVFEGTVVKGTASGTVAFRNQKGTFKITKDAAGKPSASHKSDFDYDDPGAADRPAPDDGRARAGEERQLE